MAEAGTPLPVDASIVKKLERHIGFYVRADPSVSWGPIDQRGDRLHPGPPRMHYSSEALTRSFYVPDHAPDDDLDVEYQCGWDMLIEMDRPFEVAVSRTDSSVGSPGDYLVVEFQSNKLVPWGVITRSEADTHLIRIDPAERSSPSELNVFYSYKKSDDGDRFSEAQQTLQRWRTGVKNAFRANKLHARFSVTQWWDADIRPGEQWRDEIREALIAADVVVVMVDRTWKSAETFEFAKQNELELAKRHQAIGRCEVLYFAVDGDLPQEILNHVQASRSDGRTDDRRVGELGRWNPSVVVERLEDLVREREARPLLSLAEVLGPRPDAKSGVAGTRSFEPEPLAGPALPVPAGPWCYGLERGRARLVTEVTPSSRKPGACTQAIVSDDGAIALCLSGESAELSVLGVERGWSERRPWRSSFLDAPSTSSASIELLSATRCGREYWLLWNRDDGLYRARLDREGVPWGEREVRSGPALAASYVLAPERSVPPQLVMIGPDGLATVHPPEWGSALADVTVAGIATASLGCSLASVAGADSEGGGVLRVLDTVTGSVVLEVRSPQAPFTAVRLAPDGSEVAGAVEGRIYRWPITKDGDLHG